MSQYNYTSLTELLKLVFTETKRPKPEHNNFDPEELREYKDLGIVSVPVCILFNNLSNLEEINASLLNSLTETMSEDEQKTVIEEYEFVAERICTIEILLESILLEQFPKTPISFGYSFDTNWHIYLAPQNLINSIEILENLDISEMSMQ